MLKAGFEEKPSFSASGARFRLQKAEIRRKNRNSGFLSKI